MLAQTVSELGIFVRSAFKLLIELTASSKKFGLYAQITGIESVEIGLPFVSQLAERE